jgi:hypothetical protein
MIQHASQPTCASCASWSGMSENTWIARRHSATFQPPAGGTLTSHMGNSLGDAAAAPAGGPMTSHLGNSLGAAAPAPPAGP